MAVAYGAKTYATLNGTRASVKHIETRLRSCAFVREACAVERSRFAAERSQLPADRHQTCWSSWEDTCGHDLHAGSSREGAGEALFGGGLLGTTAFCCEPTAHASRTKGHERSRDLDPTQLPTLNRDLPTFRESRSQSRERRVEIERLKSPYCSCRLPSAQRRV